jgi:hypothetical protein
MNRRNWRGVRLPSGAILAMAGGTGKSLMPLSYYNFEEWVKQFLTGQDLRRINRQEAENAKIV